MAEYLLWVEGVDLNTTVFDTTDLSCIRGASLALLYAPYRVKALLKEYFEEPTEIFTGASLAAFKFTADETAVHKNIELIRKKLTCEGADWEDLKSIWVTEKGFNKHILRKEGALPLAHIRILLAYSKIAADKDGVDKAIVHARADVRAQQLQSLGAPFTQSVTDAIRPDKARFGNILPATRDVPVPADLADEVINSTALMSDSVAARRTFGRLMRQYFYRAELDFYRAELGKESYTADFVNTVDHIAGGLPGSETIKESVHHKMAVVHIDGNQFTKIRQEIRQPQDKHPLTIFAERLRHQQRGEFLTPMLDWLKNQKACSPGKDRITRIIRDHDLREVREKEVTAYRFETLLWGGDEMAFVMPSWIALWWARAFFDQWAKGWTVPGASQTLTHAMGVVICDRRTPLRQARAMAEALCNAAKRRTSATDDTAVDAVQIEVFESVDLPDSAPGLEDYRRARYATPDTESAAFFTLTPAELLELPHLMEKLECEEAGLPRSQVYRKLHELRDKGGLFQPKTVGGLFEEYLAGAGKGREAAVQAVTDWGGNRPAGLTLALLTQYWDYVDPFGDGWPDRNDELSPAELTA